MRCSAVVATHWPIITATAMAMLAYATPAGAAYYTPTITPLIATIFGILGLTLNLTELRSGAAACHVHALLQLFSLGLCPALYYGTVYHWGWAQHMGILTEPLAVGCMAAAAMPVTAATSLVFVVQARGDAAVAAFNMAVGQLSGAMIAPLSVSLLVGLGGSGHHVDLVAALWKMAQRIVLPLTGGICVQLLLRWLQPSGRATARLQRLKLVSIAAMVALFYFIFAKAFHDSAGTLDAACTVRLVAWVLVMHLCFLGLADACARLARLPVRRRVAFVLVAPQKTEGLAIAVLSSLFPDSGDGTDLPLGQLALPAIAYHTIQMVVASVLVPLINTFGGVPPDDGEAGALWLAAADADSAAPPTTRTWQLDAPLVEPAAAVQAEGALAPRGAAEMRASPEPETASVVPLRAKTLCASGGLR